MKNEYLLHHIVYIITHSGEGGDFVIDGPLYFNFETGPGNSACITVNITNDDDYEGAESFAITLSNSSPTKKRSVDHLVRRKRLINDFSNPEGPVIGSPSSTTVTVIDPEGITQVLLIYDNCVVQVWCMKKATRSNRYKC